MDMKKKKKRFQRQADMKKSYQIKKYAIEYVIRSETTTQKPKVIKNCDSLLLLVSCTSGMRTGPSSKQNLLYFIAVKAYNSSETFIH